MGRIDPNELEKYETRTGGEWLKLQNDGDTASVQFLNKGMDDLDIFACHRIVVDDKERWVSCLRNYDDEIDLCPLCASGAPVKPVAILSMFDVKEQKVKIWERGKKFLAKLQGLSNRYGNLNELVVDIERHGAKGSKDTVYELYVSKEPAFDLSEIEKPQVLGTVILEKTQEEMSIYLDSGAFPNTGKQEEAPQVSRRQPSRSASPSNPRQALRPTRNIPNNERF